MHVVAVLHLQSACAELSACIRTLDNCQKLQKNILIEKDFCYYGKYFVIMLRWNSNN